ncbi:MAG: hypothetical protein RR495_07025 [Anaerovoracaceae bacterium]
MSCKKKILEYVINKSLLDLYYRDEYLICTKPVDSDDNSHVCERAIVFRFGIYLQNYMNELPELREYNLDCEYNRKGYSKKSLPNSPNGTYPDIILHKRGNRDNLLVIEFKTWWNRNIDNDIKKIKDFLDEMGKYKYRYGLSIVLGKTKPTLNWVDAENE